MVQEIKVAEEPEFYGKKMPQEQKSDMRRQMEEAVDAKLEEKVIPRLDSIDGRLEGIDGTLTEIKNVLKTLAPRP